MTRAEKLKKEYAENRQLMCLWTGFSEEQISEMIFETGVLYAEQKLGHEQFVSQVVQSSQYWDWWKNCWKRREEGFINKVTVDRVGKHWVWVSIKTDKSIVAASSDTLVSDAGIQIGLTETIAKKIYQAMNSPQGINEFPQRGILDESYKVMIHKLVKSKVK